MRIDVQEVTPDRTRLVLERERSFVQVVAEDDATTLLVGKVQITVSRTSTTVRIGSEVVYRGPIG